MKNEILFYSSVMKNGTSKGELNTFKKKIKYILRNLIYYKYSKKLARFIMSDKYLKDKVYNYPVLCSKIHRPYITNTFKMKEKIEIIISSYNFLNTYFNRNFLFELYEDGICKICEIEGKNSEKLIFYLKMEVIFMFTYIKLKNYKSLIELDVDLTKKENTPKKLISIYGENGIGKSNFVDSFYTLKRIISTRTINEKIRILSEKQKELQTDDFDKALHFFGQLGNIIKNGFFSNSTDIINECKTIDSEDNMIIEVGFRIKSKSGVYCIETDDTDIISEKLDFTLNKNKVNFFKITKKEKNLNESVFVDNEYKKEILSIIDKYWGKHSLLSLIAYEIEDKKENYVKKRIFSGMFEVINFFSSLSILSRNKLEVFKNIEEEKLFYGTLSVNEEKKIINIENVINTFFTALFSDIKQAYYKKKVDSDKINYILCFKKNIYNKLIDIEYNRESTGTKNILKILPYLISAAKGKTVIIDEIDNGIHDLLILKILENLSEDLKGQLIITTHNTLLLEEDFINKDSIYIFKVDENANKKLLSLNKFEGRIHPNLSIRKRYLKGLYGGIPFPMDIDFNELIEGM